MNNWFITKVKYTKELDNGVFKRVSEYHLFSAMTFTDAEARVYEELGAFIRGEFVVLEIKRFDIHDIFLYDDSDVFYRAKVVYDTMSGDDEKSKKVTQSFLVTAHSVKDAHDRIKESLSTMLVDFQIPSISISPIVDVYPPKENLDREISRTPLQKVVKAMEESGVTVEFSTGQSEEETEEEETIEE